MVKVWVVVVLGGGVRVCAVVSLLLRHVPVCLASEVVVGLWGGRSLKGDYLNWGFQGQRLILGSEKYSFCAHM